MRLLFTFFYISLLYCTTLLSAYFLPVLYLLPICWWVNSTFVCSSNVSCNKVWRCDFRFWSKNIKCMYLLCITYRFTNFWRTSLLVWLSDVWFFWCMTFLMYDFLSSVFLTYDFLIHAFKMLTGQVSTSMSPSSCAINVSVCGHG